MADDAPRKSLSETIQNGVGTMVSRIFIIVGLPALMGMGVWIGERMVGTLDKLVEKVDSQHEDTVRQINGLDIRLTVTESNIRNLERRP